MKFRQRVTRLSVRLQALMRTFERHRLQDQFSDWPRSDSKGRGDVVASVRSKLKSLLRQEGRQGR